MSKKVKNSAVVNTFERFPVLFIFDERDDKFDADLRVLFDRNASSYIKTDIIKTLLVYIIKKLIG